MIIFRKFTSLAEEKRPKTQFKVKMRVQQYKNLNFSEALHAITLLAKAQFIKSDRKCPTNSYSAAMAIFFKLSKKYFYCRYFNKSLSFGVQYCKKLTKNTQTSALHCTLWPNTRQICVIPKVPKGTSYIGLKLYRTEVIQD